MLITHKLYNMDCLEGMRKHIENNSIDLVITSPPYNIKLKSRNDYTENYLDNLPEDLYRGKIKELIKELTINIASMSFGKSDFLDVFVKKKRKKKNYF